VPKEVFIIDEMPLTLVGKIFKPALKWDIIKQVFLAELKALGEMAANVEVQVGEDKIHGTQAEVTVQVAEGVSEDDVKQKVAELLGAFTVSYNLNFA